MGEVARYIRDVLCRRIEVRRARYLGLAAAISLTLSGLAVAVYWLLFTRLFALGTPPAPPERIPHLLEMLIGWVVLAPVGETLIMMLLVGVARSFTVREGLHILTSAVPLGVAHAIEGVSVYDAGGHAFVSVIGFVVFSFVYAVWRRTSLRDAFWMSAGVHLIHNLALVVLTISEHALMGSR